MRVNAIRRIQTIALALGPNKTRTDLIPFLNSISQEDEDEVLTVLAEELGNLTEFIGGPNYVYLLLPTLDGMAGCEESLVREKSVDAIIKLSETQTDEQIVKYFVPLLQKLTGADWLSGRISATRLYNPIIKRANNTEISESLLDQYTILCKDDIPLVRRAAAVNLSELIGTMVDLSIFSNERVSTMLNIVLQDDQDSSRLLAVNIFIAIAESLKAKKSTYSDEFINIAYVLFEDKSWKVRQEAGSKFSKIVSSLDLHQSLVENLFVNRFLNLLKDDEAEVKISVIKNIPEFSELVSEEVILNKIVPAIELLSGDESQMVRASIASQVCPLAPRLDNEAILERLVPLLLHLFKDEFSDVRLNVISKLHYISDSVGMDSVSVSLIPAIHELSKDSQWRVRQAIIEFIPSLAEKLGVAFFDRELSDLCLEWLWDPVYSIRKAATINIRRLTELFGIDWARKEIIPAIISTGGNPNFLHRLTVLFATTTLLHVMDTRTINEMVVPFLDTLRNDPISNIRFNVAKTYLTLVQAYLKPENPEMGPKAEFVRVKELIQSIIIPNLNRLSNDEDVDVQYFANKSLEEIEKLMKGRK